jgi:hypothetical protein
MPGFGGLWCRIPGGDFGGKIGFISAVLGIVGFAALIADWMKPSRPTPSAGRVMTEEQVKLLAEQLIGKANANTRRESPTELARQAASIKSLSMDSSRTAVKLGDVQLSLEPPGGHCFLDSSQPSDAQLIGYLQTAFQGELRLLGGFADCGQLSSWRTGKRATLNDYGQFLVPVNMLDYVASGPTKSYVDAVCSALRAEGDDVVRKNESAMKARLEDTLKGAQLNEVRFLGVVGQDDNACYFGMVQKLVAQDGQPKTQVDVSAVAFISGKVLYTNLYALYEGDYTMGELLERQRATIARNIGANG